ncbi:MAG: hypothetical protein K6T35_11465, partial [Meiothermus silvanus]|nr:hypothetical protein [Allomeiothermus silvanus]
MEVRAGPVVVRSAPGHEAVARRALEAVRAFRFPGIPEDAWTHDSLVVLLAPDLATFRTWARGVPN